MRTVLARLRLVAWGAVFLLMSFPLSDLEAQITRRIGRAVGQAAEAEATRNLEELVRDKVRCVFDDLECIRKAEQSGKGAVLTDEGGAILVDEDGKPITDPDKVKMEGQDSEGRPGEGVWANYDFVPGDEILLYEDFTGDRVGDFPRRFELIHGSFEVVERQGGRYLRALSGGMLAIPLPADLPERFTIEYPVELNHGNAYVRVMPGPAYFGRDRSYRGSVVSVEAARIGIRPAANEGPTALAPVPGGGIRNNLVQIRIMGDGDYLKVYLGERRVANVPNAVFPRSDRIYLAVSSANERSPIMIGTIRIAAGGLDLYDRLEADGRVATQGILFATASARIRPESTPTLEEIARVLKEHPDLRLGIEGHTDSDGEDGYNQALSEQRAEAVMAYLVERHGITAARLQAAGYGESRPVMDNGTPEGKQQNRRVELVRLDP